MKILHTADWHLGKNLEGFSRLPEQEQFLADFVNLVEQLDSDVILLAGDVYDTSNPPAAAEKLFYDTLKKLSKHGERLIIVIAGNHDNPERLMATNPLAIDHGIIMVGTPKTIVPPGMYGQHQVVASGEGFIEVQVHDERAVIITVPYPSEKRLNEVLYTTNDDETERLENYGLRIGQLFRQLECHFRDDTINLAVTHLFAMGSTTSGSERAIELGGTYIVDGKVLPLKADYIALGHVHKPQIVPGTHGKARYSGSPIQYNVKEANITKQCIGIELAVGSDPVISQHLLPVYKPIETWEVNGFDEALAKCQQHATESSWVYLTIISDTYLSEAQIKQLRKTKADLLQIIPIVKQSAVVSQQRQIDLKTQSFTEVFTDFFAYEKNGQAPTPEILAMLSEIITSDDQTETDVTNASE